MEGETVKAPRDGASLEPRVWKVRLWDAGAGFGNASEFCSVRVSRTSRFAKKVSEGISGRTAGDVGWTS